MIFDNKALEAENLRLREQLAEERLRVGELTKAVIALSDRGAFRTLYPKTTESEVVKKAIAPFQGDPRKAIFTPNLSYQDVAEAMTRKEEEGKL